MIITIDAEDVRLSKSEREFLRRIALKLQADAQRRWRDLPHGHQQSVDEVFGERKDWAVMSPSSQLCEEKIIPVGNNKGCKTLKGARRVSG